MQFVEIIEELHQSINLLNNQTNENEGYRLKEVVEFDDSGGFTRVVYHGTLNYRKKDLEKPVDLEILRSDIQRIEVGASEDHLFYVVGSDIIVEKTDSPMKMNSDLSQITDLYADLILVQS